MTFRKDAQDRHGEGVRLSGMAIPAGASATHGVSTWLVGLDINPHYRKTIFIRRSKPMNIASKPMNIDYICRFTDEYVDERNSDELIQTNSLVSMNITIYSLVSHNRRIYPVIFVGDR
jgi:hypothetical protein